MAKEVTVAGGTLLCAGVSFLGMEESAFVYHRGRGALDVRLAGGNFFRKL